MGDGFDATAAFDWRHHWFFLLENEVRANLNLCSEYIVPTESNRQLRCFGAQLPSQS